MYRYRFIEDWPEARVAIDRRNPMTEIGSFMGRILLCGTFGCQPAFD